MPVTVPSPTNPSPVTSSYINGGFIFREDESLKQYLINKNIVTFDQSSPSGGRSVPVYFRMSEEELRKRSFPYILIDRIAWNRDPNREMRGPFHILATDNYAPDGTVITTPPTVPTIDYKAQDLPIPVMFIYQVQAWTRFKIQMMWIENQISTNVLPQRFGAIEMAGSNFARDDNTVRRLEFLEGPIPSDIIDPENAGKRLFGRTWTITIPSEILPSDLDGASDDIVQRVVVDPSDRPGYGSVAPPGAEAN